jgi:hypothetical protein
MLRKRKFYFPLIFFIGHARSGMKACKTQNPRGHGRPARVDTDSRLNRAHPFSSPRHSVPTLRHGVPTLRHGVPTLRHGVPTLRHGVLTLLHGMPTLRQGIPTLRHGVLTLRHSKSTRRHKVPTLRHSVLTLPPGTGKGPIDGDTREITMTRANAPTNS